jgi:DNA replication protein DnaC
MNVIALERALRQLRLGGMAAVLETRLRQAQAETMAPIDLISCVVSDELTRRADRLLERRRKQAGFRDPEKSLDNFDFTFNPKINRSLVFDLATGAFINKREDALFLGPGGTGKSHLAHAIGHAAIQQGYRVLYRETHVLLDELAEAIADGTRREYVESVSTVPLLIIDDFGMRKLPHTAAEDLLEIIMRRYERFSTLLTSNRPVDDRGQAARRCRRCQRHARSPPAPWARPQVRPAKLAHQGRGHILRKSASLNARALPSRSRDLSLYRQNGSVGATCAARHSGRWSALRSHPCVAVSSAQVQLV